MTAPVKFDDSRIKHHHDKKLLSRVRTYYEAFTHGDFNAIKEIEGEEYTMTDIRENLHLRILSCA